MAPINCLMYLFSKLPAKPYLPVEEFKELQLLQDLFVSVDTAGRTGDRRGDFDEVYGDWAALGERVAAMPVVERLDGDVRAALRICSSAPAFAMEPDRSMSSPTSSPVRSVVSDPRASLMNWLEVGKSLSGPGPAGQLSTAPMTAPWSRWTGSSPTPAIRGTVCGAWRWAVRRRQSRHAPACPSGVR